MDKEGTDAIDWASCSPDLDPVENLWEVMYRCMGCHQVVRQRELHTLLSHIMSCCDKIQVGSACDLILFTKLL